MVIYKVKIDIKREIESEWVKWMSSVHIPEVINTGYFINYSFLKLLRNGAKVNKEKPTYEIIYYCKKIQDFNNYESLNATALRKKHARKYGDNIIAAERSIYEYEDLTEQVIEASKNK